MKVSEIKGIFFISQYKKVIISPKIRVKKEFKIILPKAYIPIEAVTSLYIAEGDNSVIFNKKNDIITAAISQIETIFLTVSKLNLEFF